MTFSRMLPLEHWTKPATLLLVLSVNVFQIAKVSTCKLQQAHVNEVAFGAQVSTCRLPVSHGIGILASSRYFFNSSSGRCEEFTYGGCRGNENNFMTYEACNQHCNPNGCPPYCNAEYCSARDTRTSICTLPNPTGIPSCEPTCRITNCKVCYYDDVVRSLPDSGCTSCSSYPTVEQATVGCHKQWFTCIRRRDSARNPRGNVRSQERFKCYEYPCP